MDRKKTQWKKYVATRIVLDSRACKRFKLGIHGELMGCHSLLAFEIVGK